MALTVNKLIKELNKIENKFLEIEFLLTENKYKYFELDRIERRNNKIIIFPKDNSLK
jgi:hypothetical protein